MGEIRRASDRRLDQETAGDRNLQRAATRLLFIALGMAVPAAPWSTLAAGPLSEPVVETGFDLETVEELALYYAEESIRRLRVPLGLRLLAGGVSKKERIEEIRQDPPTADADGVVYPFGDANPLSFVHDPETGAMIAWERMIKKRGSIGLWGLTGPEAAAALNAASTRRDRGGADFGYDPQRDALSFRLVYHRPPTDLDRFHEEIDRLLAAQLKWSKGRFLREMKALVEERRTPASATATSGDFRATVALRHFSAGPEDTGTWVWRYVQAWNRPAPGPAPRLLSDTEIRPDQPLHAFVHFEGAAADAEGQARVDVDLRLIGPDGRVRLETPGIAVYRGEAPPAGHLQLGDRGATLALDGTEAPGAYRVEMEVCDAVAQHCVSLTHPLALIAG